MVGETTEEDGMDLTSILAQIVGGAVGGTAGGKILKDSDLGSLGI